MTPIIEVQNLGKAYILSHIGKSSAQEGYARLSEELLQLPRRMLRYLTKAQRSTTATDTFWALKDVNLSIFSGEVVGIIGRNGAGKSTLLKILSRITEPSEGRVTIRGRVASLLEVGTGFHPELSGRENIFLNGAILGMTRREIRQKFDEIVSFAEVERFIDTPVKRYSSGMYVRLAFSVAAHLDPEVLVVDEVLAVGDHRFQQKCMGKMRDVAKLGRTILFVSHNLGSIRQLCSRVVLLNGGRVEQEGVPEDVINAYMRSQESGIADNLSKFAADESKPFQVLSGFACGHDGEPRDLFDCDEAVDIQMKCIIREPVPGLYGYCEIAKTDGTIVMVVDSCDQGHNPLDGLDTGLHVLNIRVPKRVLGHGRYVVDMSFASRHSKVRDDPGVVAIFTLTDDTTLRGNSRGGLLSTITNWTVTPTNVSTPVENLQ